MLLLDAIYVLGSQTNILVSDGSKLPVGFWILDLHHPHELLMQGTTRQLAFLSV